MDHVQAGLTAQAVDIIRIAQLAILVQVDHHVIADAESGAGIAAQIVRTGHKKGVGLNR